MTHPVHWFHGGPITELDVPPDASNIRVLAISLPAGCATAWARIGVGTELEPLPGDHDGVAPGINNAGTVVDESVSITDRSEPVRFAPHLMPRGPASRHPRQQNRW